MTTATMMDTPTMTTHGLECGTKVSWEAITHPGCYVSNTTGHLMRVSNDFNADTFKTWMSWEGSEPNWWTWISDDPKSSVEDCRMNATKWGVDWSF